MMLKASKAFKSPVKSCLTNKSENNFNFVTRSARITQCLFQCPKTMVLVAFHSGFQIKVLQYIATCYILITTEATEHNGKFDLLYFQYNQM